MKYTVVRFSNWAVRRGLKSSSTFKTLAVDDCKCRRKLYSAPANNEESRLICGMKNVNKHLGNRLIYWSINTGMENPRLSIQQQFRLHLIQWAWFSKDAQLIHLNGLFQFDQKAKLHILLTRKQY